MAKNLYKVASMFEKMTFEKIATDNKKLNKIALKPLGEDSDFWGSDDDLPKPNGHQRSLNDIFDSKDSTIDLDEELVAPTDDEDIDDELKAIDDDKSILPDFEDEEDEFEDSIDDDEDEDLDL